MERMIFAALIGGLLGITTLGGLAFVGASPGSPAAPPARPEGDWRLLDPVNYENISVFPVVSSYNQDTSPFLTLEEGLATGEVSPPPARPSTSLFSSIAASARCCSSLVNSSAAASRTASSVRTASSLPAHLRSLSRSSASNTAAGPAARNSPPPIPSFTRACANERPSIRNKPKFGTQSAAAQLPSRPLRRHLHKSPRAASRARLLRMAAPKPTSKFTSRVPSASPSMVSLTKCSAASQAPPPD